MKILTFFLVIICGFLLSCGGQSDNDYHERPNILFIYSDDHAVPAISAYKSFLSGIVETPNLDRLAKEGMRFENAFCTNSICTPARATVLTGKYSQNNGIKTLDRAFDGSQQTFPKLLQKAGYYTGIVGKWHLKSQPTGFDYYNVLPGQGNYFNPNMSESSGPWFVVPGGDPNVPFWLAEEGKPGGFNPDGIQKHEGYVTDVITDKTLDFLRNRPKDKPFLLMYQHKAPHDMFQYDKKHAHLYKDIDIPEPFNLLDDYKNRSRAIKRATQRIYLSSEERSDNSSQMLIDGQSINETRVMGDFTSLQALCEFLHKENTDEFDEIMNKVESFSLEERTKIAYQMYIKAYLRCVASIDENIGRILNYLDEEGLTENTIVIYTSDQGFFLGEHGLFDKRFMYDESLRIPLLIRYPKKIKPGSVSEDFAVNIDFAPTLLDFAGIEAPADMDGVSLKPVLEGKTPDNWRTDMYYRYWMHRAHFNIAAHYGIRTDRYKLIFYYGLPLDASGAFSESTPPEWELFDLQKDPHEMNNVYDDPAYSEVIKDLKIRLLELKKQYGDTDEKYPELMAVRKNHW